MTTFFCSVCGHQHSGLVMDLAYQRPADVFNIPDDERPTRIRSNDDVCIIDDAEFYIRGILALPVRELDDQFCWGVWAQVDKDGLDYYLAHWNVASTDDLAPFPGLLSGGIGAYPDSDQLSVAIHLQSNNQRPWFVVLDQTHPLAQAQQMGITLHDVATFVAPVLHHQQDKEKQTMSIKPRTAEAPPPQRNDDASTIQDHNWGSA